MFLINSRLKYGCCSPAKRGRPYCELTATDLPSSLTRFHPFTLAHLRLSTCVGLRYGLNTYNLIAFLGSALTLIANASTDFSLPLDCSSGRERKSNYPPKLLHCALIEKVFKGRNINRLSIDYPFRVCLRTA